MAQQLAGDIRRTLEPRFRFGHRYLVFVSNRRVSYGRVSKLFGLQSGSFASSGRVACVPGNVFRSSGEGHVRCCFATSFENLEAAIERIKRYVAQFVSQNGEKSDKTNERK